MGIDLEDTAKVAYIKRQWMQGLSADRFFEN